MTESTIRSYADIKGWFFWDDRSLFDALLTAQDVKGTLVELGAYLGRSSVIIGDHLRDGERFVVVDLFGGEVDDAANRSENTKSYATLTRDEFERNYLALHPTLPEVIQGLSSEVVEHVEPATARFVHVDASHLYSQVAEDVRNVRDLLQPDGIVVFDDYRAEHTPGVAAAVWEGVVSLGLVPFALTPYKLYGTWGDAAKHLDVVRSFVATEGGMTSAEQQIFGHQVVRLKARPKARKPAAAPATGLRDADLDAIAARVASRLAASPARRSARRRSDYVPPVVADWIRARRHG